MKFKVKKKKKKSPSPRFLDPLSFILVHNAHL